MFQRSKRGVRRTREEEAGFYCWLLLTCCITLDKFLITLECISCGGATHYLHLQNSAPRRGAKCCEVHMIVLLLTSVSSLWLYCCCWFCVECDSALLVLQTISACDEPCVAVLLVPGRRCASKSAADVHSAWFSNDEIISILPENFSIPS